MTEEESVTSLRDDLESNFEVEAPVKEEAVKELPE